MVLLLILCQHWLKNTFYNIENMSLIIFWFIINYNSLECLNIFLVNAQIFTSNDKIKFLILLALLL